MRVHHCARLCPHACTHELLLANHLCDLRQLLSYNRLAYAPDPPRACIKSQQEVFAKLIISRCIKKKKGNTSLGKKILEQDSFDIIIQQISCISRDRNSKMKRIVNFN